MTETDKIGVITLIKIVRVILNPCRLVYAKNIVDYFLTLTWDGRSIDNGYQLVSFMRFIMLVKNGELIFDENGIPFPAPPRPLTPAEVSDMIQKYM